jgi:2-iminobutanoate/2-iminopropanoate deaminase
MVQAVSTRNAPQAIGPYSQATKAGNLLFISGQLPINPATNAIEANDVAGQTRQVLLNIKAILEQEGLGLSHVARTTIYIKNMDDFATVNEEYGRFFSDHRPARSTVEVSRLPKDVLIEIDAIAVSGE